MKFALTIAAALSIGIGVAPAAASHLQDGYDGPQLPSGADRDPGYSQAGAVNSFKGSCALTGKVPDKPAPNGKLVQRGTCTGALNGAAKQTYRVKVVTRGEGTSAGPVPVVETGAGKTKFIGRGIVFRWKISQVGTVFQITGVEGTTGYGAVVPRPDGSFSSYVAFPSTFKG